MFQGHGGILEGRVQIGLRQMAGVVGLGEKAEIGEPQTLDDLGLLLDPFLICLDSNGSMDKQKNEEDQVEGHV